jgi:hypothetical protein
MDWLDEVLGDDNTGSVNGTSMVDITTITGLPSRVSKNTMSILVAISNTPTIELWDWYGYPDDEAVAVIAKASRLDDLYVYYEMKFLKSVGFINGHGIDMEVVTECAQKGQFREQDGLYSLPEVLWAVSHGEKPVPIDLNKPTPKEEEERKVLRRIADSMKSSTAEPIVLARAVAAALWKTFPHDETEHVVNRELRRLLGDGIARIGFRDPVTISDSVLRGLSLFRRQNIGFPQPLGKAALSGIVGEFVETALPCTEADAHSLAYQLLTAVGNVLGKRDYASFGVDRHYPALFTMIVGGTATGKGQAWGAVREFMRLVDLEWLTDHCRHSAASGEGLVKLVGASEQDKRMFLFLPEMSVLLNSMNRDGSNLSGYLRQGYDLAPMENNKAKEQIVAKDYILSTLGHITPDELTTVLADVDWYNGIANRFLWSAVKKSKTLPRMGKIPEFGNLAEKLNKLVGLPQVGHVDFSDEAAKVWDEWVYSIPELDGQIGASQQRVKPNALRVALIYAALDEARLVFPKTGTYRIEKRHVEAAIEVVNRSRGTVEWFLGGTAASKGFNSEDVQKLITAVNQNRGTISGSDLCKLFPHKTADERAAIASVARLKKKPRPAEGKRGNPGEDWTW